MISKRPPGGLAMLSLSLAAPMAAEATVSGPPTGNWMNPKGTVEVNTRACGANLCGRVVWASPKAMKDARDGGTPNLIGTELLRDYRAAGSDKWRGTIFVPDMGKSFSSKMVELGSNSLQVSGCMIGGLICRKQVWHRAPQSASNKHIVRLVASVPDNITTS